ncbi:MULTISPECIES: DUF1636 family protein [Roseobacteraceae]|uniref:Metal-binding protein n=1 Tax=Pseudosulfitobacter pseudonitzschiae TaxID=1402135 RepID=A0A221K409_9RHOB|nr:MULTISPECIES: DUF1636 domain-containing protein [Roseobacteraceae]ASM73577.1 metal-binding protein [Pseudosulfitobacter pseudonitzschiae]
MNDQTELLVCIKCRSGQQMAKDSRRSGQALFDTLTQLDRPAGLRVTAVECLQNCDHGCTVALRGGARWTYVYGNVDENADPAMILNGAAQYLATADGIIPWRERPEHFKRNCVARIPPLEVPHV